MSIRQFVYSSLNRVAVTFAASMAGVLLLGGAAHAATITVNSFGDSSGCTLRNAIASANGDTSSGGCTAGSGTDTINLPDGTYTITSALPSVTTPMIINGVNAKTTLITPSVAGFAPFPMIDARSGLTGSLTLNHLSLEGFNTSGSGSQAPMITNFGTLVMNYVMMYNNVNNDLYGGIQSDGFDGSNNAISTANLSNVTLYNNTAKYTPALFINKGSLSNVTVYNNTAIGGPGGISVDNFGTGAVTMTNVTIVGNSGTVKEGGIDINASLGTNSIKNVLLSGNTLNGSPKNCGTTVPTSAGYNLSSDISCSFAGTGDLNATVPGIGNFGDHGGEVNTVSLTAGGAAVNAGTATGAPSNDARGHARAGTTDIGAFELDTVPVYRLANYITHERLFTTDLNEKNSINGKNGWVYEMVGFDSVVSTVSGAMPVYRLANYITHERLFTTDLNEKNSINGMNGWVYENIAYYGGGNIGGNTSVYRLANYITHERLFTTDLNEKNSINGMNGWVYEQVAFSEE